MWLTSRLSDGAYSIENRPRHNYRHKKVITKTKIDADSLLQFFRPTKIELK